MVVLKYIIEILNIVSNIDSAIVSSAVTSFGYIISISIVGLTYRYGLKSAKRSKALEKLSDAPYDLTVFMDSCIPGRKNKVDPVEDKKLTEVINKIVAYGSSESIRIAVKLQNESDKKSRPSHGDVDLIYLVILLIMQLRYDVSDEMMSPVEWFDLKLANPNLADNDPRPKVDISIRFNELVDELKLNPEFKAPENKMFMLCK